jgi:tetratricopeptide (TPR) repeat protein
MDKLYINNQYQNIIGLINHKRLKEAIALLERYLCDGVLWDLYNQLEQIRISYNYMLQYMRMNVPDSERKKFHYKLLTDTMEIADRARIEKLAYAVALSLYYKAKNTLLTPSYTIKAALMELENYTADIAVISLHNDSNADNERSYEIRKQHEKTYHVLFLAVWTNPAWNLEEESEAHELLHSVLIPVNDVCLFVSAVTLSLMECFDLRKFLYLFDAYNHDAAEINQRALVGIVLIIHLYTKRLQLYPEITARFALLNENEAFGKELNRVYIQLLLCRETEKIEKTMREEIIPEMLKSAKSMRYTKFDMEEPDEERDDRNPDWQDVLEQSGLGDKIRKITELQMEGADIYMGTFAGLKTYSFFRNISNWFYPFDRQHSDVVKEIDVQKGNAIMDMIFQTTFFCDSDKYSLCFTMANIPPAQRESMMSQLNTTRQDMDELNKKRDALIPEERAKLPESFCSQYLRNLYRFFKLHPYKHEFRDVFNERIELHKYSVLADILNKPEHLMQIAGYYFHKGYPVEAAEIYTDIVTQTGGNAELFQKIGYCKQKEKKYVEAIDAYLKADMFQPDNLWTNRRLAACYRMTQSFEKALKYYQKVEAVQPEEPNLLFYIGSCFAGLERYPEALHYFYQLDLQDSNNLRTWRAISWCSFVAGKYEQAEKYYRKILEDKPLASDYLNAGHVAWSMKQMERVIELYSKALELCGSKEKFIELFHQDYSTLIKQGIHEDDIWLMPDLLG